MCGEEHLADGCKFLAYVLCERHVELLVHGFKLGVESAYHHVVEAVGLYSRPVVHFVRRDVVHIAGHIVACVGVGAGCSDGGHEFVVLVWYEVACGNLRH